MIGVWWWMIHERWYLVNDGDLVWPQLIWDMDNLKICKSVGLLWQIDDTCSDEWSRRCDLWECFTNRGHRCSKTWVLKGSRSASIGRRIRKWSARCWDPREWASMLIPELQEFHRLFAQMDILQQKLIKFWSRDTLICDNVLGSGSPTPPGVEFWRIKIRFYPAGHRETSQQHNMSICRAITLRGKIKGLKKVRILDGLFDKIAAPRNQGEQQELLLR